MELRGRHIVVTGAASGIGEAMARRFAAEKPARMVLADIDRSALARVADELGAVAAPTDVSRSEDIERLVAVAHEHGPIDLFCSNAGVFGGLVGVDASADIWDATWRINVMAHVYAARAVLPKMLERGEGYLLNTASAAGLLLNMNALPYTATKHAAVAVAEWLSVTYGARGIRVSCLCPQGVKTPMLAASGAGQPGSAVVAAGALLDPDDVAVATLEGLREERFLILPHPEVARYFAHRATDHERWLGRMQQLQVELDIEVAEARTEP